MPSHAAGEGTIASPSKSIPDREASCLTATSTGTHPGALTVMVAVLSDEPMFSPAVTAKVEEVAPEVFPGTHHSAPADSSRVQEPASVRISRYSVPPSASKSRVEGVTLSECSSSTAGFTQAVTSRADTAAMTSSILFIIRSVLC